MPKLLHISASPRPTNSYSRRAAGAFVEAYAQARPDDEIETLDLWQATLPEFDGAMLEAKYAVIHQRNQSVDQEQAWGEVKQTIDHFAGADLYLISTPMWNFGIPYRLKHYIDIITQPGLSFGFDVDSGYFGLLKEKSAVVICARGGTYPVGSDDAEIDFQWPYLRHMLSFVGVHDVKELLVEATVLGDGPDLNGVFSRAADLAISTAQAVGSR